MTVEFKCAYRHHNGDVEGFVGHSKSVLVPNKQKAEEAKADAMDQIKRKLTFAGPLGAGEPFDESRLITTPGKLTKSEFDGVVQDWKSGTRY